MNVKIIGLGAAGNKAALRAVSAHCVRENDVLLLNTAIQDIAAEYKDRSILFNKNGTGGCGKERSRSKELITDALQNGSMDAQLSKFIDPGDLVVIVTSTEGGTGSGAAPILAAYINEVIGVRPQLICFTGTEDDLRGLQNTADFFKDVANMCDTLMVQAISNKKFLDKANGNKLKAEIMANDEFVLRIKVLQGAMIRESDQNIDAMDHLKLVTTPGYMSIVSYEDTGSIDTTEQFDKICIDMLNASKSLPTSGTSMLRLGVIMTIADDDKDHIDWSFKKIKSAFEDVGEVFLHVQKTTDETRQIILIMSGLEMPLNFVMSTYEKFKARSEKMAAKSTNFLSRMGAIDTNDDMLNINSNNTAGNKASFFNKIGTGNNGTSEKGSFKNTKKEDPISNM